MTTASRFFDMTTAPVRIGMVRLAVRDPDAVAAFYQSVLGLERLAQTGGEITLGVAPTPLLELRGDPALRPQDPHQAGLFHTAFLLPTRADLARWLVHARQARVALQGASNHQVSEAIYLADPEGNGIEVYADRPLSHWHGPDGHIRMRTDPLDLADLLSAAEGTAWAGFPGKGASAMCICRWATSGQPTCSTTTFSGWTSPRARRGQAFMAAAAITTNWPRMSGTVAAPGHDPWAWPGCAPFSCVFVTRRFARPSPPAPPARASRRSVVPTV